MRALIFGYRKHENEACTLRNRLCNGFHGALVHGHAIFDSHNVLIRKLRRKCPFAKALWNLGNCGLPWW